MGFWEDSSPIVKVAIALGVAGLVYFGSAFVIGWPPFEGLLSPTCTHLTIDDRVVGTCPEGVECEEREGCPGTAECVRTPAGEAECVQNARGVPRN